MIVSIHDLGKALNDYGINLLYVRVTLDGVRQSMVTIADDDLGMLERYVTKDDGRGGHKLVTDPDNPEEILTETLFGKVELIPVCRADGTWPHPGVSPPVEPKALDLNAHLRF
jgi:hypothetical protein